MRYPRVLGHIFAGIILGLPAFSGFMGQPLATEFIGSLADLGVIFLMLLAGTNINLQRIGKVGSRALTLAALGYAIPFLLGFLSMSLLGYELLVSCLVGACLAISAQSIMLELLMEYRMLKTDLGTVIMEAGLIDDLLAFFSLAAIIGVSAGRGLGGIRLLAGDLLLFIAISFLLGVLVLPRAAKAVWKERSEAAVFSLAVIFGLLIVLLSSVFSLSTVIGAFVAGVIIQLTVKNKKEETEMIESLSLVTFGLVVPFFFIHMGLLLDIGKAVENIWFIALITGLALAGKLLAAHLTGIIYSIRPHDRNIMGWGMNSRGEVELIIASIAFEKGLFTVELFSAILSMALISSAVSVFMFKTSCLSKPHTRKARKKHSGSTSHKLSVKTH